MDVDASGVPETTLHIEQSEDIYMGQRQNEANDQVLDGDRQLPKRPMSRERRVRLLKKQDLLSVNIFIAFAIQFFVGDSYIL